MASFTDILREQRSKGQGLGSSLKTAFSERARERLDPRNYLFKKKGLVTALFPSLKGYQAKTDAEKLKGGKSDGLGGTGVESILNSIDNNLSFMKSQFRMVAKNSIVLPQMARDTNITKQNIAKLLKSLGEKPTYDNDMFFQNRKKRESQYKTNTKVKVPKASRVVEGVPEAASGGMRGIIGSVGTSFRTMLSGMGNGLKVFGSFLKESVIGLGRLAILFAPEGLLVLGVIALGITIANLVSRWKNWSPYDDAKNAAKNALGINTNPPANNRVDGKVDGKTYGPRGEKLPPANPPANPPKGDSAALKGDEVAVNSNNEKLINPSGGINFKAIGSYLGFDSSPAANNRIDGKVIQPMKQGFNSINAETEDQADKRAFSSTSPLRMLANIKEDSAEAIYGKHTRGLDTAVQRISRMGLKTVGVATGLNDKFHQVNYPNSKHTQGLAADLDLTVDPDASDANMRAAIRDRDSIIAQMKSAGLNFTTNPESYKKTGKDGKPIYDGYAEIETKKKNPHATGPHLHFQFRDENVAKKWENWSSSNLGLYPSSDASTTSLSPSSAKTSASSSAPPMPTAPPPKLSDEEFNKRIRDSQNLKQQQLNKMMQEGREKPPVIIDNKSTVNNISGGGGGGQSTMMAAVVYNPDLEWYMSKLG
jgi:hypothetical protein